VAEVPDDRALERLEVGERAAAVGDVAQHHEAVGHLVGLRAEQGIGRPEDLKVQATGAGDAFEHVAVGREVVLVGDERGDAGVGVEDRVDELVEVDGDRVRDEDGAGLGADHLGQRVAGAGRRGDPVEPAADELVAPLLDDAAQALARALRQPAERVAVEVELVRVVDHEALAEARERVARVERFGVGAGQSHPSTAFQSGLSGSRWP
jgi:hypothetical protein